VNTILQYTKHLITKHFPDFTFDKKTNDSVEDTIATIDVLMAELKHNCASAAQERDYWKAKYEDRWEDNDKRSK
jgi:hypothetical protein